MQFKIQVLLCTLKEGICMLMEGNLYVNGGEFVR